MTRYVIVPIVEGHGEVQAVPILIQRWLQHRRFHLNFSLDVKGPVRFSGKGALKVAHNADDELGVEHYIGYALLRRPDAIIVVLDADDDAPASLGPVLLHRARASVPSDFPILCLGWPDRSRDVSPYFLGHPDRIGPKGVVTMLVEIA